MPFNLQWWVFLAFFLGFAIKVPMFPFHTWLPDAHTDAPTAGSVILAAVLLKMGTYGFLRFSLPILPEATRHFVPMMVLLSIIGIVYGALVALAQKDWKRLVAYSSVSHMAMVMLGMFALNPVGITGSIVQQLNHGISTGALFLLVGVVYERRHTREISEYGGLSKVMPVYAAVFLIMTMSSIGLPTLNGFIGEFLILQGVFVASKMWAAFAASGVVLGAAYMLYLYQRTMFGKIENPKNERLLDLSHREFATFAPLHRPRGLDRALSGAVPAPPRDVGAAHRRARQPAVRGRRNARRCGRRAPTPRRLAAANAGGEVPGGARRAAPTAKPLDRRRRPAGRPGSANACPAFRSATSITSCRSWCSRRARCSCSSPTCCCRSGSRAALAWVTLARARRDAGVAAAVHGRRTSRSRTACSRSIGSRCSSRSSSSSPRPSPC